MREVCKPEEKEERREREGVAKRVGKSEACRSKAKKGFYRTGSPVSEPKSFGIYPVHLWQKIGSAPEPVQNRPEPKEPVGFYSKPGRTELN